MTDEEKRSRSKSKKAQSERVTTDKDGFVVGIEPVEKSEKSPRKKSARK